MFTCSPHLIGGYTCIDGVCVREVVHLSDSEGLIPLGEVSPDDAGITDQRVQIPHHLVRWTRLYTLIIIPTAAN